MLTDEEFQSLSARALEEYTTKRGLELRFHLELDLGTAIYLISQLHLALRHPQNTGDSADTARAVIETLISSIRDLGFPAVAELAGFGADRAYDGKTASLERMQ